MRRVVLELPVARGRTGFAVPDGPEMQDVRAERGGLGRCVPGFEGVLGVGAQHERRHRAEHLVVEAHHLEPGLGQGVECRQVFRLIGGVDLGQLGVGPVCDHLIGDVGEVVVECRGLGRRPCGGGEQRQGGREGLGVEVRRPAVVQRRLQAERGLLPAAGDRPGVRVRDGRPGGGRLLGAVAAQRVLRHPVVEVELARVPRQLGEELERRRVVDPLGLEGDAGHVTARLGQLAVVAVKPRLSVRTHRRLAAAERDRAEEPVRARPVRVAVRHRGAGVRGAVGNEQVGELRGGQAVQFTRGRVVRPAELHPGGPGLGGLQGGHDGARRGARLDRSELSTLLQGVHPVHGAAAQQRVGLLVVVGGHLREQRVGRREPRRPLGAVPSALGDGVGRLAGIGGGVLRGEVGGHGAVISRNHRGDAQLLAARHDLLAQRGVGVEQGLGDRRGVVGDVLHHPPRLRPGKRDPCARLSRRVAEALEDLLVHRVRARKHIDLVDAVQRVHVQHVLPLGPVHVRVGIAVLRVVALVATIRAGRLSDGVRRRGQHLGNLRTEVPQALIGVHDVLEIPARTL